jgi:uncharacterized protein (DUF1697 family)
LPRFVAFLRAINVGGHTVRMEVLRRHFGELGFRDVTTFIASGNVAFATRAADREALERKIERRLEDELGFEVATFIRTDQEVAAISAHRPFTPERIAEAKSVKVAFLARALDRDLQTRVLSLQTSFDDFHFHGRELYWLSRRRQGESTISNLALERAIAGRCTVRGVATVRKIAAALTADSPDQPPR